VSDRRAAQLASSSDLFGIDTRTLGLFRIVLGTLLLLDGIARAQHLGIHYTDSGIAPLVTRDAFGAGLSLHWLSGGFAFQFGMMASQLAAALALVVGFHARRAAFFCWLLLTSLHFRSPYLDDGGDSIARMMLLWSIFLPIGERFSLDAKRATGSTPGRVLSPASVGILLQFVLFYCVAGLSKTGPAWLDGSAVAIAIDNSYWSRPFGDALLDSPALLEFLTFATRGFEIGAPLLLFVPVFNAQLRLFTIVGFWLFQLGLATSLELNFFPFFASAATLVFIPGFFWDRWFPRTSLEASEPAAPGPRQLAEHAVTVVMILASLTLAAGTLGWLSSPRALNQTARFLSFEQSWTMYGPDPPPFDLHFRILGHQGDGKILTLVASDSRVDHGDAWNETAELHTGYRMKDHLEHLMLLGRTVEPLRQSYLAWMCRTWNRIHPNQPIADAAFVGVSRATLSDRNQADEPLMLSEHSCN